MSNQLKENLHPEALRTAFAKSYLELVSQLGLSMATLEEIESEEWPTKVAMLGAQLLDRFPKYQHHHERRLSPNNMLVESRITCIEAALIIGTWWEKQSVGNRAHFFIAPGDPRDAHVVVALSPQKVEASRAFWDEYDKFTNRQPTNIRFFHYDRKKKIGDDFSEVVIEEVPPGQFNLQTFHYYDYQGYVQNRANVFGLPIEIESLYLQQLALIS